MSKIAMHTDLKTAQRTAFLAALLALVVGLASLAVSWKNHADITELNARQELLRQEKINADLDMLSKALFDNIHFGSREPRPVETDAEFRARTKQFADAMCEGFNRGYDEADKSNAKPKDIAIFQPMLIACAGKGKSPVN
ncbi:hypothetical protein P2W50_31220 [Pseudomonas protegens]|uniref:hypothetical protein n=1 Tax=Pseudomonas protegens TaxID=380021 RepID=UPI0023EABA35|nr:hypothetical protein [Pseudomonas protegens]MDF4211124.1 hypothetical protein [Pseudomonas protegens]